MVIDSTIPFFRVSFFRLCDFCFWCFIQYQTRLGFGIFDLGIWSLHIIAITESVGFGLLSPCKSPVLGFLDCVSAVCVAAISCY